MVDVLSAPPDALGRPEPLALYLRRATAEAHQELETSLDLFRRPMSRDRCAELLKRFYGFHLEWEAALRALPSFAIFLERRPRLSHLQADLAALGCSAADLAAAPRCEAAPRLASDAARALGSAYVMEGSTLGGQVIQRALRQEPWFPAAGLAYFNPYGARTGEMWRCFKSWLEAHDGARDRSAVARGATHTFGALQAWLTR